MAEKGDVRFQVGHAHRDDFETPDDANDGMGIFHFADFDQAAGFAEKNAKNDYFGVIHVTRETCVNPRYDWWEADFVWYVEPGTWPVATQPDHVETETN